MLGSLGAHLSPVKRFEAKMAIKITYEIDGYDFDTLDGFFETISNVLVPGVSWGKNLDALNDILSGGFGTPEDGFVLKWKNSEVSRVRLGFPETIKWLHKKLEKCHPSNRDYIEKDIVAAENGKGSTLFEIIIEIIHTHGSQGEELKDGVELILE